jgi:HEXXH motif-containing protein
MVSEQRPLFQTDISMSLPFALENVEPDPCRAAILRRDMDRRLLASLDRVVSVVARRLKVPGYQFHKNLERASQKVRLQGEKVRPWVYGIHWSTVAAIKDGDGLRIERLLFALISPHWCSKGFALRDFPCGPGRHFRQQNMMNLLVEQHRIAYKWEIEAAPLTAEHRTDSRKSVRAILKWLRLLDPASYGEIQNLISEIALIRTEKLNAGSSFPIFGCMYLNVMRSNDDSLSYLEHLIHETAHHFLFGIWTLDPVIVADGPTLHRSPLRREPRPLSAIFHQMFVLARVIRVWSIFQRNNVFPSLIFRPYSNYQNDTEGTNFKEKFEIAQTIIRTHARLTAIGKRIFESSVEMVEKSPIEFH